MSAAVSPALVSIIIPVYNAEKHVAETIQSVIDQTWPNKEIILVDDGSADASLAVIKQYENEWIKVFTQQNKGASVARNHGLLHAKGDYIQFLDADDVLSADKIASQMEVLEGSQDYICLCETIHFENKVDFSAPPVHDEWYKTGSDDPVAFLLRLYTDSMVQPNAWLTPKKMITAAGPWNEFKCPDDDGEYFCRVILAGKGVKFSYKGVNYYRKYDAGTSLSGQRTREATENLLLSIDLKYSHLAVKAPIKRLNEIFSKHYWELGVAAYPKYMDISATCIKKAKKLGYAGLRYKAGKISMFLSKILGWRVVRVLTYLRYEL